MYAAVFSMRGAVTALALAVRLAALACRAPGDVVSASEHATMSEPAISARRFIVKDRTAAGAAEVRPDGYAETRRMPSASLRSSVSVRSMVETSWKPIA